VTPVPTSTPIGNTDTSIYCISVGGGNLTINGKLIAPDIDMNGNGFTINPPGANNDRGLRPYLAE
jgi:hypothetical protein